MGEESVNSPTSFMNESDAHAEKRGDLQKM
jgi:hypothetical protein